MRMNKGVFLNLMLATKRTPFSGRVLTLGSQHTTVTYRQTFDIANEVGCTVQDISELDVSNDNDKISDIHFFKFLGFETVDALDYDNYEGAEVIFDLNECTCPQGLRNRYQLIVDGGRWSMYSFFQTH